MCQEAKKTRVTNKLKNSLHVLYLEEFKARKAKEKIKQFQVT
jgi:hypothetical protein